MIISYMPIHQAEAEDYEGQHDFEEARAFQVWRMAEYHDVPTWQTSDTDTTYLGVYVSIPAVKEGGGPAGLDLCEAETWDRYVEFLMDLEASNLGHLLHKVDTEAEYELVESLLYIGDDSPRALAYSLRYVDVDYRAGS